MFNHKVTQYRRKLKKNDRGFSLMESLISLTLFLFVALGSIEFFNLAKVQYFKLREEHETNEAAFAALDKMRMDFEEAGRGLLSAIKLGILSGLEEKDGKILIVSKEKNLMTSQNLVPGQTRIELTSSSGVKKNRQLCIHNSSHGEVKTISSVDDQGITLSSPLSHDYSWQSSTLSLLKNISLYLDVESKILRRKVNTSTPQPLLENTQTFDISYDGMTNLIHISFVLLDREDKKYETSILPKNLELAVKH